jgi:hypothetical protein
VATSIGSPAARDRSDDVAALPWPYPVGLELLEEGVDEYRIDAASLLAFVQANDLGAVSH